MTVDSLSYVAVSGVSALRPTIVGSRHVVSSGHYLAAHAAFQVLENGGNAVDAGVTAGLVLGVVQSEMVNIAGVAPIMLRMAQKNTVETISGLGWWPAALSPDWFMREFGGHIPEGLPRSVIPAAPDAWITALATYGTISFSDAASYAIRFAKEGFVMYPLMAELISAFAAGYARWPSSAAIYLPGGRPPQPGEIFRQQDLAGSLQYMADCERAAAPRGRLAGLQAARDAFYRGDIARSFVRYHERNGGLLRMEDFASYRSVIEPALSITFRGMEVYSCGPWCQGPSLLQALKLLEGFDLPALVHNSANYLHVLIEAMKLTFSDRHHFYGDPKFVDVPLGRLLSSDYARDRRSLIRPDRAWVDMPPAGDGEQGPEGIRRSSGSIPMTLDTSYVAVIDRWSNVFSATPSDMSHDTPVIPGTGLAGSSRGSQSWADPAHPSSAMPGKRPRLTPNPAMVKGPDGSWMAFGTPGGDVQVQAMLQVLLNFSVFGMDLQAAVEAPRIASYSFPDSFEPHGIFPARVNAEARISRATADVLSARGHDLQWWPEWVWRAGAVCVTQREPTGIMCAAADPRRPAYALGW